MKCMICPRNCNIDRTENIGFCGQGDSMVVSKVMLHHYEEPIISGEENGTGSGAIFFSGCNLKCVFCQNYEISHFSKGEKVSPNQLADIMKDLFDKGAYNINLVTPTHFTSKIIDALKIYRPPIPIVWNSSGYESAKTIKRLKKYIDIYLVDLKYQDDDLAIKYSKAPNYSSVSRKAIIQMRKNQPKDIIQNGLMKKGIIVRLLVLPTHTEDSKRCLDFVKRKLGEDTIVSIMSQYEPTKLVGDYPELSRKITPLEYKRVVNYALDLGLNNAYIQDLSSADMKYTPKF